MRSQYTKQDRMDYIKANFPEVINDKNILMKPETIARITNRLINVGYYKSTANNKTNTYNAVVEMLKALSGLKRHNRIALKKSSF